MISCRIGNNKIGRTLVALRASESYSVHVHLGLEEQQPTNIILQLADRSIKIPMGVIEDVLLKVDAFYFAVDFVVLYTQPVPSARSRIPLILGCSFLATSNALIYCRKWCDANF